jgi:hypothetical protein
MRLRSELMIATAGRRQHTIPRRRGSRNSQRQDSHAPPRRSALSSDDVLSIADCVDFRVSSAARPTNRLILLPLFRPKPNAVLSRGLIRSSVSVPTAHVRPARETACSPPRPPIQVRP